MHTQNLKPEYLSSCFRRSKNFRGQPSFHDFPSRPNQHYHYRSESCRRRSRGQHHCCSLFEWHASGAKQRP